MKNDDEKGVFYAGTTFRCGGAVAAAVGVRGRYDVCTSINKAPGGHLLFLVIVMAAHFG